jgi:hypothetical protein
MTTYTLGNDYGITWPIWSDEGQVPFGTPSFSANLQREVIAWAAEFNDNYLPEAGWPTEKAARTHHRQGERLRLLIERELAEGDAVILRYWETNRRKGL